MQRVMFLVAGCVLTLASAGYSQKKDPVSTMPQSAPVAQGMTSDNAAGQISRLIPFRLMDQDGKAVSSADFANQIVVLEWTNTDCPVVKQYYQSKVLPDLARKYQGKVAWLSINSTFNGSPETNKAFAAAHQIAHPILDDYAGQVGRSYGASKTPEIFIFDKAGQLVYQGGVDNNPSGQSGAKTTNYVDLALTELLAGQSISTPRTKALGCSVQYADAHGTPASASAYQCDAAALPSPCPASAPAGKP